MTALDPAFASRQFGAVIKGVGQGVSLWDAARLPHGVLRTNRVVFSYLRLPMPAAYSTLNHDESQIRPAVRGVATYPAPGRKET